MHLLFIESKNKRLTTAEHVISKCQHMANKEVQKTPKTVRQTCIEPLSYLSSDWRTQEQCNHKCKNAT